MNLFRRTLGWDKGERDSSNSPNEEDDKKETEEEVKQVTATPPAPGSFGSVLWNLLSANTGRDVFTVGISLPSWMYEPLSILQRQTEMIEHADLLTQASKYKNSIDIMIYVAAFAVSGYSATKRYKPNFNPILGETFEFIDKRNQTRLFAEQVSHHPPISAIHAENEHWMFWQNSCPTTKFLGNAIDVDTHGNSHVFIKSTEDHIFYQNPVSRVHNVVLGQMWIEHWGELTFNNFKTGEYAVIKFTKCGMFQGVQYNITGKVYNAQDEVKAKFDGKWDEYLDVTWCVDTKAAKSGEKKRLWELDKSVFLGDAYNFTKFTHSLNEFDDDMKKIVLPTDSRRRLDLIYLTQGKTDLATTCKKIMEERQRQERKKKTGEWSPVWFKKAKFPTEYKNQPDHLEKMTEENLSWVISSDYWPNYEKRKEKLVQGKDCTFDGETHVLGGAADFLSYLEKDIGVHNPNFEESTPTTVDSAKSPRKGTTAIAPSSSTTTTVDSAKSPRRTTTSTRSPEKPRKAEKAEESEKVEKPEKERSRKSEKAEEPEKSEKSEKSEKDRSRKSEKAEEPEKGDKAPKKDKKSS